MLERCEEAKDLSRVEECVGRVVDTPFVVEGQVPVCAIEMSAPSEALNCGEGGVSVEGDEVIENKVGRAKYDI